MDIWLHGCWAVSAALVMRPNAKNVEYVNNAIETYSQSMSTMQLSLIARVCQQCNWVL